MILHRQVFMNIKIAKKIVFGCMLVGMTCFLNAEEVVNMDMPPLEKSFIKLVNKALDEYASATNEVKKTKIKLDLRKSSSVLLKDRIAKDWVGKVINILSDNTDGSARIGVALSIDSGKKAVSLTTASNKAEDDKFHTHTGIDIGSDLYNAVSELEKGDKVIFSGRFVSPWPNALIMSIFESSGMVFGGGAFKFTSIKKIQSVKKSK